jgi:hypothetical protein
MICIIDFSRKGEPLGVQNDLQTSYIIYFRLTSLSPRFGLTSYVHFSSMMSYWTIIHPTTRSSYHVDDKEFIALDLHKTPFRKGHMQG